MVPLRAAVGFLVVWLATSQAAADPCDILRRGVRISTNPGIALELRHFTALADIENTEEAPAELVEYLAEAFTPGPTLQNLVSRPRVRCGARILNQDVVQYLRKGSRSFRFPLIPHANPVGSYAAFEQDTGRLAARVKSAAFRKLSEVGLPELLGALLSPRDLDFNGAVCALVGTPQHFHRFPREKFLRFCSNPEPADVSAVIQGYASRFSEDERASCGVHGLTGYRCVLHLLTQRSLCGVVYEYMTEVRYLYVCGSQLVARRELGEM
ncbi:MAG TPA: hypothetical protein VHL98_03580 [Microvirga sp.]|nr:hypothetical protein [Microvirga sp.]